jgi:hypothetical protein
MMKKLYRLNMTDIATMNIGHLNPTMKAIVKTMYRLEKANKIEDGLTGDQILSEAVKCGLWSTRQEPSKYHTTWAYYVKELKKHNVIEVGTIADATEEYLE